MKKKLINLIFVLILALPFASCTSDNDFEKGKRQLELQGYTNIENTGHSWFCCDDKDKFSTGFKAKDKDGNEVEGCFCSGYLKGITIRFK